MLIDGECRLRKTALHILIIAIRTLEIIVGRTPLRRLIEGKDPVLSHMSLRINIDIRIRSAEPRFLFKLFQRTEHRAVFHIVTEEKGILRTEIMRTQTVIENRTGEVLLSLEGLMEIVDIVTGVYDRIPELQHRDVQNTGKIRIRIQQRIVVDLKRRIRQ